MKIQIEGVEKLQRDFGAYSEEAQAAIHRAVTRSINQVAAKVNTQARRSIASEINLPQSYIKQHMSVRKASHTNQVAYIVARHRAVRMARFDARQITERAKALRAKGDPLRKIPSGRKAAGVSVKIKRQGGRTSRRAGFLIPLRAGTEAGGNGMGVFVRTGPGKKDIKHKYGASPYQLFRAWAQAEQPNIQDMLQKAFTAQARYELTGSRT